MPNYLSKWEAKLPKIPIIVIQIHYKTQTIEKKKGWGERGMQRNIPKFEPKLSKPDAENFTKLVTRTAENPDNCASISLKTLNP